MNNHPSPLIFFTAHADSPFSRLCRGQVRDIEWVALQSIGDGLKQLRKVAVSRVENNQGCLAISPSQIPQ